MRREVTIIQYRLLHYRIALFEEMRIDAQIKGLNCACYMAMLLLCEIANSLSIVPD
jgi:hypothetical protein